MNPHLDTRPLPDAADLAEFNAGVRRAVNTYADEQAPPAPKATGRPRRPCATGCGTRTRSTYCPSCRVTA